MDGSAGPPTRLQLVTTAKFFSGDRNRRCGVDRGDAGTRHQAHAPLLYAKYSIWSAEVEKGFEPSGDTKTLDGRDPNFSPSST